ncbi:MAG TPA: hypothetical protein VKM00_00715, partial [Luteimonas sp.]|nr:hypothetical protein [Luteimonas sp.]
MTQMIALALACTAALAIAGCTATASSAPDKKPATAQSPSGDAELVARGEYMVRMGGCNDCHTPG